MVRFACELGFSIDKETFEVAKKYLGDIQAVVTEALDNLDRLPTDTASVLDNITTESFCYELLKKYTGTVPLQNDVLDFKNEVERLLQKYTGAEPVHT